ncbi:MULTISPECIES: hypothetical protein [Pseudomonadota]|jgi:lauroyl/myristoyl acyltransferase
MKHLTKWLAAALATAALISIGVPAPMASTIGNTLGDQAQELME